MRFLRRFFPKKTESVAEFVDFVLRNRCMKVEVVMAANTLPQPGLPGISMFEIFSGGNGEIGTEYLIFSTTTAPDGEKMEYVHARTSRYVASCDYAQDHEQHAFKMFLDAERLADALRHRLATVPVDLLGSSKIPMTKATRDDLRRRAKEGGILH